MLSEDNSTTETRKKRFVLLFDDLQSVHLFKDVGQVPFQMYKHFGYAAEIVCRRGREEFAQIDPVLQGLKITVIDESPYRYLLRQARDIDVLMLMHISTRSAYRGILYKFLNPKGCLYIKADQTGSQVDFGTWVDQDVVTHLKRVLLRKKLITSVDLVSFETRGALNGADVIPAAKRVLLPNGFDPELIDLYGVRLRSFAEKENLVLLVARHGDQVKNTELMLDALALMGDIADWQVCFVGPMTPEFEQRKDLFLHNNPRLAGKVTFTGQIDDKRELFELYSRAKILCLTSRRESWGLVCVEAMVFGCVVVMTAVSSANDITNDGTCGIIIDSHAPDAWATRVQGLISDSDGLERLAVASRQYCAQHFYWQPILQPLSEALKLCTDDRPA